MLYELTRTDRRTKATYTSIEDRAELRRSLDSLRWIMIAPDGAEQPISLDAGLTYIGYANSRFWLESLAGSYAIVAKPPVATYRPNQDGGAPHKIFA